MPRRARLTIAAAVAVIAATGIGVLAVALVSGGDGRAPLPLGLHTTAAVAPFVGYGETRLLVDGHCRRVVVADTATRREQGVRGNDHLGPYAGMLFVNAHDTTAAFTMAGVTAPLEIGWFTVNGARVGGAHLVPCPGRDEAHCPVYRSTRRYRLALETPGGSPATTAIAGCG